MANWSVEREKIFPKGDNPFGNHFYGYRELVIGLPDGRKATYNGSIVQACVHVVALESDETTYLVRQSRPNVMAVGARNVPETLELPGGFADPNDLEGSAKSELEEEISRTPGKLKYLGPLFPSVGISNEQDHIYLGTELSPVNLDTSRHSTEQDMMIVEGKFSKLYDQMLNSRLPVSAQTLAAMAKVATQL